MNKCISELEKDIRTTQTSLDTFNMLRQRGHKPYHTLARYFWFCVECQSYFELHSDGKATTQRGSSIYERVITCEEGQIAEIIE